MNWWVILACCVLLCGEHAFCAAPVTASSEATQQLDLADLPKLLHELAAFNPGKKSIDEEVLLRSREKLFSLFDPEKIYLLESEVAPFVTPQNGKRFLSEYQQNIFTAYYSMLDLCRAAILRSRTIRKGFFFTDSQTIDKIRTGPSRSYDHYAADRNDLTSRLFHKYVRLITDRLPTDAESDSKRVQSAVAVAERQLEAHESSWLALDTSPRALKEKRSAAARVILKTILSSLDMHSDVMGEKGARDIRERLTKESFGTGVVPYIDDTGCFVKKIVRGSPADLLGGIFVSDRIVSIDRKPCSEMSVSEINELLNGEKKGFALCALKRAAVQGKGEQMLTVSIPRSQYTVLEGRVEAKKLATPYGTIVILRLHSFYRGAPGVSSSEDVKAALAEASSQGPIAGVILDLRDNGGGYITEAVRVVGEFIKTGVVMMACYADGSRLVFRDIDPDIVFSGPMVVLTSKDTASAAEIVSQALKDYGRAIIVGDPQTYGKGSIQMQTVTDKGEKDVWENVPLRYTVGRFYTVSGYSPQRLGVKADIVIPGMRKQGSSEEEAADGRLQQKIDPLFHDSLDDVQLEVKGWYQEHYLPFIQEPTDRYRRWIPVLQKKSTVRMRQNPLWAILAQKPASALENEGAQVKIDDLQMAEAIAIEEDLLQLSKNR